MANLTLSGYLATEAAITWPSGQDLVSLTDNEFTDVTAELDNSSTLYRLADLRMVLASAAFTGTDSGIECYLIPTVDGTNYPTWTGNGTADEQENVPYFVGFIPTTGTTAAQAGVLLDVPLPNGKFKFAFRSRANVTLAGSGNTIYWRPHTVAV